jgi:uncharacterized membrane protein
MHNFIYLFKYIPDMKQLISELIEDVKNITIDVKIYKNYIKNHENWDHKYNNVLHNDEN